MEDDIRRLPLRIETPSQIDRQNQLLAKAKEIDEAVKAHTLHALPSVLLLFFFGEFMIKRLVFNRCCPASFACNIVFEC